MKKNAKFEPKDIGGGVVVQLRRCLSDRIGIVRTAGALHLVAIRPLVAGEVLFRLEGTTLERPSRHSAQIGARLHVDVDEGMDSDELLDRYFWRFLNHGCEPNVRVLGRDVIALRDIRAWEDVTYNYNTTEYELAEPFSCCCGSPRCFGEIRGFRHLSPSEREILRPLAAPHLLEGDGVRVEPRRLR